MRDYKKIIVVTGAAGFIGSNFAAQLADSDEYRLHLVDEARAILSDQQKKYLNNIPHEAYYEKNQFLNELAKESMDDIHAIIHMGACSDTTVTDRNYLMQNNTEYSKIIFEYCAMHDIKFIYASSAATYGYESQAFDDNERNLKPLNYYGESKYLFDEYVLDAVHKPPQWVGLKFFNVYGHNEYHKGNMASVILKGYEQILDTGSIHLFRASKAGYENGGEKRDFVYVKDVLEVIMFFLRGDASGIFNVGTGKARTFIDLAMSVFKSLGRTPSIQFIDMPEAIKDKYQYFTQADMSKLKNAGYTKNFHELEDGIQDYVTNYLIPHFAKKERCSTIKYTMYKLKNLFLLLLCYLKYAGKGKANRTVRNPKKILITQLAHLGDIVCTTPMFRAVKKRYPDCKVYVLGNVINKVLLENSPDVDGYIVYDEHLLKTIKRLNREHFDFACTATSHFAGLVALYLSNIPAISATVVTGGFCPQNTKSYQILVRLVTPKNHDFLGYAPGEYLKLLTPLAIHATDTKKHLGFSDEAKAKVYQYLAEHDISSSDFTIGIAPSVGNKIKMWEAEKFAAVADHIYNTYHAKIIIIDGKKDQINVLDMIKHLDKQTKVINFAGLLNLDELKACISMLSLFISVDTGPLYIAEAFSIPSINIIGPLDEKNQSPVGPLHRNVKAKRNAPAIHIMNARVYNHAEARRQVEDITAQMVIRELDDLIKTLNRDVRP